MVVQLRSWVRPCFYSIAEHFLFVFLGWFVRWVVGGRTAVTVYGAASRICWKQHAAYLYSSHFYPSAMLKSRWCCPTIVLTWLQMGRIPIYKIYRWEAFLFIDLQIGRIPIYRIKSRSIAVHAFPIRLLTWWDIATDICEIVYQFLRFII